MTPTPELKACPSLAEAKQTLADLLNDCEFECPANQLRDRLLRDWLARTPDFETRALEAEKKLQKLGRLIDFAHDENEAMTEKEVAATATFKEALAHQNAEMLEEQVEQLQSQLTASQKEVERLKEICLRWGVGDFIGDYYLGQLTESGRLRQQLTTAQAEIERLKKQ